MSAITIESYDLPSPAWNPFVEKHPHGKIYHLYEWNQVVNNVLGKSVKYIEIRKGDKLSGILPLTEFSSLIFGRFAVSQPFINYGGPLFCSDDLINPLENFLTRLKTKCNYKHIELRLDKALESKLSCKQHKVTFMLDLPSHSDELMASFKAKLRSQIKRPQKENMYAKTGGAELLADFYHVFTVNMRDLGTPPLPKSFFKAILNQFPNNAFIVIIYTQNGNIAAGSFLIKYKDTVEIPWASSIRAYNRLSPNMLLYWESLKLSIEQKAKYFDFGRCTPNTGTYRFKKQWKAKEQQLYWYYVLSNGNALPELNPENSKFALAIKTWTKLPVGITKLVGPFIIKNIP